MTRWFFDGMEFWRRGGTPVEVEPATAVLRGRWRLSELAGSTADDAQDNSNGTYTGTVTLGEDSLVSSDTTTSIRLVTTGGVAIPSVSAFETATGDSGVIYFQVAVAPSTGQNMALMNKDATGQAAGWAAAVINDSGTLRIQMYRRNASGTAQFLNATSTGVGTVLLNHGHMLAWAFDGTTLRAWLDKVEIGTVSVGSSPGTSNTQNIGLGRYRPGITDTAGLNGWIKDARFYSGALVQADVDALADAQDVEVGQVNPFTFSLPNVPDAHSAAAIIVSTSGNDANAGTLASPKRTVQAGINAAAANNGIVELRSGVHFASSLTTAGKTNLTIRGYRPDIEADPLNPANWPTLAGYVNPSSITWELFNAGRSEYRTTATNIAGAGIPQGFAIAGTTWRLPRYEPEGGQITPNRGHRLLPYGSTVGSRTATEFRDTGTVALNQNSAYHGPGLYRETDGRIHIRLGGVDPSYVGGDTSPSLVTPFSSTNPDNNSIYIWAGGTSLFTTLTNGTKLEGVIVRGYDKVYNGAARTGFQINDSVIQGGDYTNYALRMTSGTGDISLDHTIVDGGLNDWTAWHLVKNVDAGGSLNYGRITFCQTEGGTVPFTATDCAFINLFDVIVPTALGAVAFTNCYTNVRDDVAQPASQNLSSNIMLRCYLEGPGLGWDNNNAAIAGNVVRQQQCLQVCNRMYLNQVGQRVGHGVTNSHGGTPALKVQKVNCTIIGAVPCREPVPEPNTAMTFNREDATAANCWIHGNNIIVIRGAIPPGGSIPATVGCMKAFCTADTAAQCISDGNQYFTVLDSGVPSANKFWGINVGATRTGAVTNFATLAAFKLDAARYTASGGLFGSPVYTPKREQNSVETDPGFAAGTTVAVRQDSRGRPPADYIPTSGHTGVNLSAYGFSNLGYAGALDPSGDGTEIGPRFAT